MERIRFLLNRYRRALRDFFLSVVRVVSDLLPIGHINALENHHPGSEG